MDFGRELNYLDIKNLEDKLDPSDLDHIYQSNNTIFKKNFLLILGILGSQQFFLILIFLMHLHYLMIF